MVTLDWLELQETLRQLRVAVEASDRERAREVMEELTQITLRGLN